MNRKELKSAFENKLITEEVFKNELLKLETAPKIKKQRKLPVVISPEEFAELIKHTKHSNHKIAFLLGFGAGLRVSEIVTLEPRHIFFKLKKIFIEQGKGGKDRNVPLPKGFREEHIKLFPLGIGVRALEKAFKSAAKRAKLLKIKPTLHFHSLRHGFATNCLNNGMPIHHVRTLMGHSNISTTNIYLEANPTGALASYEELF
jgi:integrase